MGVCRKAVAKVAGRFHAKVQMLRMKTLAERNREDKDELSTLLELVKWSFKVSKRVLTLVNGFIVLSTVQGRRVTMLSETQDQRIKHEARCTPGIRNYRFRLHVLPPQPPPPPRFFSEANE